MTIQPCPHCGDEKNGFVVKAYARGPVEHHFDSDGQLLESSWDHVYSDSRGVVRCGKCGRIRRDVRLDDYRTVVEA